MYSAIEAEVPIESDPATTVNEELLNALGAAQRLIVCGQATSHCCNHTVRDIVKYCFGKEFVKDRADPDTKKLEETTSRCKPLHLDKPDQIYLLQDCMSDVTSYEKDGESFFADMEKIGLKLVYHDDPNLFELPASSAAQPSLGAEENN